MKPNGKQKRNTSRLTFGQAVDKYEAIQAASAAEELALAHRFEAKAQAALKQLRQRQNEKMALVYSRCDDETKKRVYRHVEGRDWDADAAVEAD